MAFLIVGRTPMFTAAGRFWNRGGLRPHRRRSGKLLVVRAEVRGGKAERPADAFAFDHGAEDRELPAEQACCAGQVAGFHGPANERAADNLPVQGHRRHADFGEAVRRPEFSEQVEIAGAAFAKRPLEADADFAQRPPGVRERADEVGGLGGGEVAVERDDENVVEAEAADELELVQRGGEKARCLVGAEDADRVRVEGDGDGGAARQAGVVERAAEDGLVPEMHSIEDADGEEDRAGEVGEVGDGAEGSHGEMTNDE